MKKRICAFLLSVVMILSVFPCSAFAAGTRDTSLEENMSRELKGLGLFKGVSDTNFDLNRAPSRVEALVMLIRLLGKENETLSGTWVHPFTDVPKWADKYIGYAYQNGLTNGVSATKFGTGTASSTMYLTFVLRALGYSDKNGKDFSWDNPTALAKSVGIISDNVNISNFWRADVVAVSYAALSAKLKDSDTTLVEKLINEGVITKAQCEQYFKADVLTEEESVPETFVENSNISTLQEVHANKTISAVGNIESFSDHWYDGQCVINEDLSKSLGLTYSLTVSDKTSIKNAPETYDQNELIEWGKDPGLGVDILHQLGYTGEGAVIAYIDQPIEENPLHSEFKSINLHYTNTANTNNSMHGPAVLSLLAGEECGTAPGAEVYFYGHSSWFADQTTHANCLYQIIEKNKTLPEDKKIKMVGFSDNIDESEANADAFRAAVKACEDAGIMVWFCAEYSSATFTPLSDKSDPENLAPASWGSANPQLVYVPAGSRTTATSQGDAEYIYWSDGGLSWTMPYMLGLYSIAISIDSSLTQDEIRTLVVGTAFTNSAGMRIVNPVEFIATVLDGVGQSSKANALRTAYLKSRQYLYAIMDTASLSSDDLTAIADYLSCLDDSTVIVLDVASYSNAAEIYSALKIDHQQRGGTITGVQIFGNSDMVPAFIVDYKVQMQDEIDDGGQVLSDLFYSNLDNDTDLIKSKYNVCDAFANNSSVDLIPDWPVVRLPLAKGEYKAYFEKYNAFAKDTELVKQTIANFSNPIFANSQHTDDMGIFLNRMNKELKLIDSDYMLYGNLKGQYPVTTKTLGDFTADNITKVNKSDITEFIINTHGQANNMDCCYFVDGKEVRESLMNSSNINSVLNSNPYYLDCWTCNNAYQMKDNLICTALNGKCVGAFAATTIISNNGVNNLASVSEMKNSNFYYFYYVYLKELNKGNTRSQSFFEAQKAYAEALIADSENGVRFNANYQFNMYNLICYGNYGVIEPNVATMDLYKNTGYIAQAGQSVPKQSIKASSGDSSFKKSELTAGNPVGSSWSIKYTVGGSALKNQIEFYSLIAQKLDNGYVRIKLEYKAPAGLQIDAFNPPNGDKFMIFGDLATGEKQIFEYDLLISDLASIEGVTMKLFNMNSEGNEYIYVFYNVAELKDRL